MTAAGRRRRPRMDQPAPGFQRDPRVVAARKGVLRDRIRQDRRLSSSAKVVGFALLDYLNGETGWAWPGIPKLAKAATCDERTVRRALKKLAALGYIVTVEGGGTRRGERDGRTNAYTIHWHAKSTDTLTEMSGISGAAPSGDRPASVPAQAIKNYRAGMSEIADIHAPEYRAGMPGDSTHVNPSTDSAQRARERATGDDGCVAAAAAARPAQQVEGRVVDHRIVHDVDRHPRTEHQLECDYFEARVGARIWWMPNTQAKPPVNAEAEFAEQVFAFQRAAGAWTIREADGIRIIVPAPAEALPSAEAITTFARALLEGADWAIELSIRLLDAIAVEREVEAEICEYRAAVSREFVATGEGREMLDLLGDLDHADLDRRLAACVRAAGLAAEQRQRDAGAPAAASSNVILFRGCRRSAA